jgi:hypothetical protein
MDETEKFLYPSSYESSSSFRLFYYLNLNFVLAEFYRVISNYYKAFRLVRRQVNDPLMDFYD